MDAGSLGSSSEVQEVLLGLGLNSTELRAYQFLLKVGAATPTLVARETGQSRGRIYETLRLLVEKGLAREEPRRPIRYLPVPIAEVLSVALADTQRRALLLRQVFDAVANPQPAAVAPAARNGTRTTDVAVFSGRRAVTAETLRLLTRAREFFLLQAGGQAAVRLAASHDLLRELRSANERNVRVEIQLPDTLETSLARRQVLVDAGAHAVRTLPPDAVPPTTWIATDEAALWIVAQPDDGNPVRGDDVAVRLAGRPFVEAVRMRFQTSAPHLRVVPPAPAATIPEALDPETVTAPYVAALSQARVDVVAMGPKGWGRFSRQGWERVIGAYANARARGVRFRALTQDAPEELAELAVLRGLWDLRVAAWIPVWLVLVDRKELFQAFPGTRSEDAPRLRHSQEAGEVAFYGDLFERLWTEARPLDSQTSAHPTSTAHA